MVVLLLLLLPLQLLLLLLLTNSFGHDDVGSGDEDDGDDLGGLLLNFPASAGNDELQDRCNVCVDAHRSCPIEPRVLVATWGSSGIGPRSTHFVPPKYPIVCTLLA